MSTTAEQREHRVLLAEALRSGRFEQTRGRLRGAGHCCLGVGCEVYREATEDGEWLTDHPYEEDRFAVAGWRSWTEMPELVRDWYGITDAQQRILADLNDTQERNFDHIADVVLSFT